MVTKFKPAACLGILKFHVVEGDKTILLTFYLGYLEFDEEVSYNLGSRLYLDIKTDALSDVFSAALSYNYWLIASPLEKKLAAHRDEK